jgi:hypothetical protein
MSRRTRVTTSASATGSGDHGGMCEHGNIISRDMAQDQQEQDVLRNTNAPV